MNIFSRYSPAIQRYIYSEGWSKLRAIQAAAGDAIFNSDANVLLSASTASGKTEAAFFPIITLLQENPSATVGCLYIAPLKALINDQFTRLNDICRECDIDVWHWHGDVSQEQKKKLLRRPSGILQITPESLEAMLLHRHSQIPSLFGELRFVVIDEIHSFLRGDRGGQMLCLLERLSRMAESTPVAWDCRLPLANHPSWALFSRHKTVRGTIIPKIQSQGAKWRISVAHFSLSPGGGQGDAPKAMLAGTPSSTIMGSVERGYADEEPLGYNPFQSDVEPSRPSQARSEMKGGSPFVRPWKDEGKGGQSVSDAFDPSIKYILDNTRGHRSLIFSNSREECEVVCSTLRTHCEALREPDRFLIHHGNLSASYRESAEAEIKREDSLMTVCTTSTLELGIDIGRLERAFQIDAPFTVSSFLQRMGRTGRRGAPSEMWFVIREEQAEPSHDAANHPMETLANHSPYRALPQGTVG